MKHKLFHEWLKEEKLSVLVTTLNVMVEIFVLHFSLQNVSTHKRNTLLLHSERIALVFWTFFSLPPAFFSFCSFLSHSLSPSLSVAGVCPCCCSVTKSRPTL